MGPAKRKEATTKNPDKYWGFYVGGLILHFEIVILVSQTGAESALEKEVGKIVLCYGFVVLESQKENAPFHRTMMSSAGVFSDVRATWVRQDGGEVGAEGAAKNGQKLHLKVLSSP